MRFVSLTSVLVALSSGEIIASDVFPEVSHAKGVFKATGSAPGGLTEGVYIPNNPVPMWRKLAVFAPNVRMMRVPVVFGVVIPTYFLAKSYLDKWRPRPIF